MSNNKWLSQYYGISMIWKLANWRVIKVMLMKNIVGKKQTCHSAQWKMQTLKCWLKKKNRLKGHKLKWLWVIFFVGGGGLAGFLLCYFFWLKFVLSNIIFIMMLFDKWLLITVINKKATKIRQLKMLLRLSEKRKVLAECARVGGSPDLSQLPGIGFWFCYSLAW